MRFNRFLVLLVVFAVIFCSSALGSVSAADVGNNSTTPGQSKYTGPQTNTTKWINDSFNGPSLTVTKNGTVCALSNGNLYTVSPNGTIVWNCSASTFPIEGNDGTTYILNGNTLSALNPDGSEKWTYETLAGGSPLLGHDGVMYFVTATNVYAVDVNSNPNGKDPKWIWVPIDSSNIRGGLVLSSDGGTLYFGTYGSGTFYALNTSNGEEEWSYSMGGDYQYGGVQSTPVIGPDGTIYIGTQNYGAGDNFFAFDPDNSTNRVKWSCKIPNVSYASAVIGSDGTIYIGTSGGLYALDPDPDATERIKGNYSGQITYTPVIGVDGTIYVGTYQGYVYAFNPDLTLKWQYLVHSLSRGSPSPVIGSDGTLYIGFTKPYYVGVVQGLYAFQDLVGNFTSTSGSGLDVSFTDTSTNIPKNWIWDFGDGSGSDLQNPTHTYSAPGVYNVTLTVITEPGDMATVSKLITVNRAPTLNPIGNKAVDENKKLTFTVGGFDLDGDNLTYSITGKPDGATFNNATGAFSWTPSYSQAGTYTVTFSVSDGNSTVSETITITVNNVNRAPTINSIGSKSVDENKKLNFTVGGSDLDGDNLTYTVNGLPSGATFNNATGAFSWTPTYAQAGTYHITFTVSDGTSTTSETVKITVKDVDTVAPTVSKVDPSNGATKVSASKTIKVTFNEAIKKGSNFWVELKNSSGKAVSFKSSVSGKVLTIDPKSNLAESLYTLVIHTGAVTDLAGNPVALKSSKFSVGTAPTVSKVDPKNGATKVARSKTIKVTFNENIKAGSNYWIELKTNNGKSVKINSKSINGKVLSIKTAKLAANTKYKLTLHTGAVTDKAGNPVALKTYTFTTGKT